MNILAYVHLRNIYGSTGAGRLARNMVEELARSGRDQIEILADPSDHRTIIPKVGAPWDRFSYRFLKHETSRQQALWIFLDTPKAEAFWPDADVVYCAGESYVPKTRARLAVTVHDAAFFEAGAHRKDWDFRKQRAKWRFLYHKLSRTADRFLAVSQFSADRLSHFFPKIKDRLRVVPSAVPSRFFQPVSRDGEDGLAALGLTGRRFIMLPNGFHHRKNADLVLKAWPILQRKYPELLLVVPGHSDPVYLDRAKALGPSVHLVGFVDDELLCSLYHAAASVWFPSLYEGFGLPPLEAMACGTPVVASNCSSLPEVSGSAALMVSPSSVSDHVEALTSLLESQSLADELIAKGRPRALNFTWEAAGTKLRAELQSLT